ncbi:MAG TPA: bifunctional serine/threonine-protein kinase/formylglycine-generating enzyme family protein [Patescibacteria group bacterium]|nr:bifunctional serine/threonine-protein kinase/formylglycine-generating enzyme family protein [Patescibacteria group bacterium]
MMDKIGKYTISGEIGKGGMGVVYRGLDPVIGRSVAVKTVRLDILRGESGREDALKRFLREAQAAGNLSHANIVTIYDVGEHEGLIYIAMEFIDGCSLEQLLQQERKFTLQEITHLFSQIGSALDYAHGKGIVHRDIKPANILVGRDLKVSIVDFGIARTAASTMTQTGMLMGTPRYMSPEQIAGKKVDNRSDIFSLGAILYELLTQHNPFAGESITTVIYKIMHAELPPLSDFNKQLPAGLEGVVKKALARDADARYHSCGELLADLKKYALAVPQGATVRESNFYDHDTQLLEVAGNTVFSAPRRRRKPLLFLTALLVGLLAAALFVFWPGRRTNVLPSPEGGEISRPAAAQENSGTAGRDVAPDQAAVDTSGPDGLLPGGEPEPAKKTDTLPAAAGTGVRPGAPVEKPLAEIAQAQSVAGGIQDERSRAEAAAANKKGFLERVFFNGTVMVQVRQGNFTIGSPRGEGDADEHPAHKIFISDFWLGKTEVTFEQFDLFCRETGRSLPSDEGWGRGSRPVINVSWDDADSYCRWLAQKTGRNFRLPREAEWEKAAREKYPWGRSSPSANQVNMKGKADGFAFTAPVGSFALGESPYGILDMAGNVWEWMADWYDPGYYQAAAGRDPQGPAAGKDRVVRGGSWRDGLELIRSANRSSERPERRLNVLGFRVAMDYR